MASGASEVKRRARRADIAALLNDYANQELILRIEFPELNTAMTIPENKFRIATLLMFVNAYGIARRVLC
jgi:hypothetical protein